jgi:hypothetical protein
MCIYSSYFMCNIEMLENIAVSFLIPTFEYYIKSLRQIVVEQVLNSWSCYESMKCMFCIQILLLQTVTPNVLKL